MWCLRFLVSSFPCFFFPSFLIFLVSSFPRFFVSLFPRFFVSLFPRFFVFLFPRFFISSFLFVSSCPLAGSRSQVGGAVSLCFFMVLDFFVFDPLNIFFLILLIFFFDPLNIFFLIPIPELVLVRYKPTGIQKALNGKLRIASLSILNFSASSRSCDWCSNWWRQMMSTCNLARHGNENGLWLMAIQVGNIISNHSQTKQMATWLLWIPSTLQLSSVLMSCHGQAVSL